MKNEINTIYLFILHSAPHSIYYNFQHCLLQSFIAAGRHLNVPDGTQYSHLIDQSIAFASK